MEKLTSERYDWIERGCWTLNAKGTFTHQPVEPDRNLTPKDGEIHITQGDRKWPVSQTFGN